MNERGVANASVSLSGTRVTAGAKECPNTGQAHRGPPGKNRNARRLPGGRVSVAGGILILGAIPWLGIRADAAVLPGHERAEFERMEREWRYLAARAARTEERVGKLTELEEIRQTATRMRERCAAGDVEAPGGPDGGSTLLGRLSARILCLSGGADGIGAYLSDPYERLDPEAIPPATTPESWKIVSLPGEHHAVGVVLWNGASAPATCRVSVAGLDLEIFACDVRRQVFMETYYTRERERVADPLPRLPRHDRAWSVTVPAGGMVKLYVGVGISEAARGAVSGWMRCRHFSWPSSSTMQKLRACCFIHTASGWGVHPAMNTRLVPRWMKNST